MRLAMGRWWTCPKRTTQDTNQERNRVMAKKAKKVKKKGGPSKRTKLLHARQQEIERLEEVVERQSETSRRNYHAIRKTSEDNDKLKGQLKELKHERAEMLKEMYGLVKCLNATREAWFRTQESLKRAVAQFTGQGRDEKHTYSAEIVVNAVGDGDVGSPVDQKE